MQKKILKHLAKFYDVYELVMTTQSTYDDLKKLLVAQGMPETSARRCISEFKVPFCSDLLMLDQDGEIYMRPKGVALFLKDMAEWLGEELMPVATHKAWVAELEQIIEDDEWRMQESKKCKEDLAQKIGAYELAVDQLKEQIGQLREQEIQLKFKGDHVEEERSEWEEKYKRLAREKEELQVLYDEKQIEWFEFATNPVEILRLLKSVLIAKLFKGRPR